MALPADAPHEALPPDVQAGLDDLAAGRVRVTDALDLLAGDAVDGATLLRFGDRRDLAVTDTFLQGWGNVYRPVRSSTLELMDVLARGNRHPAMRIVPLGSGGVFALSAFFDVELAMMRRPDGHVIWLSVAS